MGLLDWDDIKEPRPRTHNSCNAKMENSLMVSASTKELTEHLHFESTDYSMAIFLGCWV